jgi:nitrilase
MNVVKVAVVQSAPIAFDRERTLERAVELISLAGEKRAQLILFPEAYVSGYPRGLDFGVRVGSRTPAGRELFRRYWESAVDVPGPVTDALGEAAASAGSYVVIGIVEREGGTLYCSVLFFDAVGELLGKHRKLMPTAAERLIWGFGDGSTMPVFNTKIGRMGAVICWENYMPLLRMHIYS